MFANAVNYVYHLLMGRLMGPVDYGILSSLYSVLYIISIIPISTSLAIVKFISSAKDKKEQAQIYHSVNKGLLVLASIGGIFIILFSGVIARFLNIDEVLSIILIGPVLFFSLLTLGNQATSQGRLEFLGSVVPTVALSIIKLALGLVLVLAGYAVGGAILAVLIGGVVSYWLSKMATRQLAAIKVKKGYDLGPILRYSLPTLLQAIAFTSLVSVDVILVKHYFSGFDAGLYAAISTLGKIIFFATQPVTAAMFPVISARRSRQEKYTKVLLAASGLTLLMSAVLVAFYYLLPNLAIGMLYGQAYLAANQELVWIGLYFALYAMAYLFANFFLSIGKTSAVYLALLAAVGQIVLIGIYHASLLEVIQVSVVVIVLLCASLAVYFWLYRKQLLIR